MQRIILLFITLGFPLLIYAQDTYSIKYHVYKGEARYRGQLVIRPQGQSFYSEKTQYNETREVRQKKSTSPNMTQIVVSTVFGSPKKTFQIYPRQGDSLVNIAFIGRSSRRVIYPELFQKMEWQLKDSTKVISGFQCYKAFTTFRGREYAAWFTPEIPIHIGPWKFNNLPGAILQVYDKSKTYSWNAYNVVLTATQQFSLPADYHEADSSDLKKMSFKAYLKKDLWLTKKDEKERLERFYRRKYGTKADVNLSIEDIQIYTNGRELKFEWEN